MRVVAYIPTYRGRLTQFATPEILQRITHAHLAFAQVDASRVYFADPGDTQAFVTAAHQYGVKVLVSLGGANGSDEVAAQTGPATLPDFVARTMACVETYGLDGVDLDIEGSSVDDNYGALVDAISAQLTARGKLLSAAVGNWFEWRISDAALARFDYVGVMAYDACGTWTEACPHSTVELAQSQTQFWVNERALPANRAVVGLPFYGYSWGVGEPASLTYAEVLSRYPDAWQTDWIEDGTTKVSYNGEATIQAKVQFSKAYGGVMIWELGQDVSGPRSLLRVLNSAF